jgi:uncharacterized protein (TIGR00725 family)
VRRIAVFGGGDWVRGGDDWALGYEVGRRIAFADAELVTGGYGGAMEAASEGAASADGKVCGIVHLPLGQKSPNSFVTTVEQADDYADRLARLLRVPEAVALPGLSGTFAEIAASFALLQRMEGRRLALWAPWWRPLLGDVLTRMSSGHMPGVAWLDDLAGVERWLSRYPVE